LAFLGAGHSHLQGDYQDTVRRGLEFLIRSQASDGSLFGDSTLYAQMYCHSMATFALAEAQAMTGDARLRTAVAKAVEFSVRAQHPATGGWRYRPAVDAGDTSQLGWQMMALASAQRAGVDVPTHTWTRVARFLRSVRRGQHGGLASYRPDGPPSTSMTAEALYCRGLLHEVGGEPIDPQAASEATKSVLASLPARERINLYYWYYASLALHQQRETNDQAATAWTTWNDALIEALVSTQHTAGSDAGSWNVNTVWGGYGGRVYTTAMAAMCLEVYYRYAPTSGTPSMATRPDVSETVH
jgi:squalene cyclase